MTNYTELIDRYMASWNETDPRRRQDLIARTWVENSSYVDPVMRADGHKAMDAMIDGVHKQFPGLKFRRTTDVDGHNGRLRFGWELGPESGPAVAGGVDFGTTNGDLLQTITGFFDFAPKPAA